MHNMAYKELNERFFKLHQAREYEQAFSLLEGKQQLFPEQARQIYYNQICASALAGRQSRALQILKQALEQGYWFSSGWLLNNPDLTSLHEHPEFKATLAICEQHKIEAQRIARPELLILPTEEARTRYPLLLAMHGNGGNATNNSEPWSGVATHGWLVALPQSSQVAGPDAYIWNDRAKSTQEIQAHWKNIWQKYSIDLRRTILGGFSMGGGQAVWMALHASVRSFGFVVLAPYLTSEELDTLPALLADQPFHGRGYIIVGENDAECLPIARQIAEIMHNANYLCKLEIIPDLGHDYPADFSARVIKGLAFVEYQ